MSRTSTRPAATSTSTTTSRIAGTSVSVPAASTATQRSFAGFAMTSDDRAELPAGFRHHLATFQLVRPVLPVGKLR